MPIYNQGNAEAAVFCLILVGMQQVLMPLRAFGDVSFKWSRELQSSVLQSLESGVDLDSLNMYHYTPPNYLTPPYLDATPEILYHKLRPQDRFLILGSDGLWDEMGSKQAVQLVGEHLSGIHLQVSVLLCFRASPHPLSDFFSDAVSLIYARPFSI